MSVDVTDPHLAERIIKYCQHKGLRIPTLRRMQPFARQRKANPDKPDNYISVDDRWRRPEEKRWHQDGGPPRAKKKLSEDFHFMMRCLHFHLPKPKVHTNSSKSEDRFAHVYGMRFGDFANEKGYCRFLGGEKRLPKDKGFEAVKAWLIEKVIGKKDPFGWKGYSLTHEKIAMVSYRASNDWSDGWLP